MTQKGWEDNITITHTPKDAKVDHDYDFVVGFKGKFNTVKYSYLIRGKEDDVVDGMRLGAGITPQAMAIQAIFEKRGFTCQVYVVDPMTGVRITGQIL